MKTQKTEVNDETPSGTVVMVETSEGSGLWSIGTLCGNPTSVDGKTRVVQYAAWKKVHPYKNMKLF